MRAGDLVRIKLPGEYFGTIGFVVNPHDGCTVKVFTYKANYPCWWDDFNIEAI